MDRARANEIMNEKSGNRFDLMGHVTRGEAAVILMHFMELKQSAPEESGS